MAVTSRAMAVPTSGHWKYATVIAMTILIVVMVRIHELLPVVPRLRPAAVLGFGGIALLLMYSKERVIGSALESPTLRLAGLYLLWAVAMAPFALWQALAVNSLKTLVSALLPITALLLCAPTRESFHKVRWVLVGATLASAILVIVRGQGGERLEQGGMFDSNDLASLMAIMVPFAMALVVRGRGWHRLLGAASAIAFVAVAVKTGSRGGTIALAVAAVVFVLGFRSHRRAIALVVLLAGALVTWEFAPPNFQSRITALVQGEKDYNYTAYGGRKQIWKRARGYIRENPITGVGIGNFPVREGNTCTELGVTCKWSATHNAYLQAGAELGLVGLALFVGLLVTGARQALPLWRPAADAGPSSMHHPELLASLLGFSAGATFLSHAYFFPLFGLLGIIAYASRIHSVEGRVAVGDVAMVPASVRSGWRTALSRDPGGRRAVARTVGHHLS